jgi:formiminoglutamate deiminase
MDGRYHCELAWLGGDALAAGVVLDVAGGVITGVTTGVAEAPAGAVPLAGLTLPGLANAHSHAFHRALRGRTHSQQGSGTGSFWTWRQQMYGAAEALTPESYFALARAVFAEMVLAGVTSVGEFHYLHHDSGGVRYVDPNAMGRALAEAAADAGLRLTLLDTCYLHGGFGVEPEGVQRRFSDGTASAWAERAAALDDLAGPRLRLGAAIHSVRAVDPASMEVVAAWAAERAAPLHAHVSEQPVENRDCLAAYGLTPTAVLARAGALGERFTAVHATHLTDADIDDLGGHRCSVCCCPTTERDLADGVGPARRLVDAGARLTLGSDSQAVIDLFEEARGVELHERLHTGARGHHRAVDLLRAATVDGHASIGWPEVGALSVGAAADLVTVDLGSVRLAGTEPAQALEAVVFAATAADVRHVVVGGEIVVADGRHVRLDVVQVLERSLSSLAAVRSS